ncbi:unnamed protein product [Brassica oleracea]
MTPFINSLEIRPLKNGTYDTQSGSLITVSRFYFPPTKQVISTNLLVNSTNSLRCATTCGEDCRRPCKF